MTLKLFYPDSLSTKYIIDTIEVGAEGTTLKNHYDARGLKFKDITSMIHKLRAKYASNMEGLIIHKGGYYLISDNAVQES